MKPGWHIGCIFSLLISCSEKGQTTISEQSTAPSPEIVLPSETTDTTDVYEIKNLKFHLPKQFYITESIGPDFWVYSILYPGGSFGGIAFSRGPNVGNQLSNLMMPEAYYKDDYRDIPQLMDPIDTLYRLGTYYKEGDYYKYDYESDSFINVGNYAIEAMAIDSFFVWYHYPLAAPYGSVDIVLDDNEPDRWFVHVFAQTNPYLSWDKVRGFSDQLVEALAP